ncbi:PEP-CTERM sorting domain-containing protein [Crocosphaera sp.]|uniref:PEP-CTERM sorting domain-containing protein n=1 Tax=Crocosphaera sp. TaxID=2729996 RepID=UPI003F233D36|nr:PEP-CTERM sorting domain-containing protein [Crocosphaera sp.]
MKNNILNLLGVVGITVGMTTMTTAAQASQLGPGRTDLRAETGVFFTNNIIDFLRDPVTVPKAALGQSGDGVTTTLPCTSPDCAAGVFGIVPTGHSGVPPLVPNPEFTPPIAEEILAKLGTRSFIDAPVLLSDIYIDPDLPPLRGPVVTYTFPDTLFLQFDTDKDGQFGSADDGEMNEIDTVGERDFEYFITSLTRTVTPGAPGGGFNVSFDLEGFFRDYKTVNGEEGFKDTPSIISLFNGATDVDPNTLPDLTREEYDALPGETPGQIAFLAGADGVITTEGRVPEPGTILGLTALAGLGLGSRLKRKSK